VASPRQDQRNAIARSLGFRSAHQRTQYNKAVKALKAAGSVWDDRIGIQHTIDLYRMRQAYPAHGRREQWMDYVDDMADNEDVDTGYLWAIVMGS
jgi:hypothetical protein